MEYTGQRNSKGKRHGQGTLPYANGRTYSGEWKDNKQNGLGTYIEHGLFGRTYTGEWKDGEFNGQGIWLADGIKRTCEWKDGKPVP